MIRPIHCTLLLVSLALAPLGCSQQRVWLSQRFSGEQPNLDATEPVDVAIAAEPRGSTEPVSELMKNAFAVARLTERRGEPEQAVRIYQEIIERSPDTPVPYHRLGVIRADQGHFAEAEGYFSQAISLDPTNAELLADIGHFCYLSHLPDWAEEYLRRALEQDPHNPRATNNLAVVLGEQGRYEQSFALFCRNGSEAQAHTNIGYMYAQRGDLEKAAGHYSRALTLDGNMRPAAHALMKLAEYLPQGGPLPTTPGHIDVPEAIAHQPISASSQGLLQTVGQGGPPVVQPARLTALGHGVIPLDEASARMQPTLAGAQIPEETLPCAYAIPTDGWNFENGGRGEAHR